MKAPVCTSRDLWGELSFRLVHQAVAYARWAIGCDAVRAECREKRMTGKFISSTDVRREHVEWGSLAWFSSPAASNAKDLVVLEVNLNPAAGHNFHKHPKQEEVLYVIEGEIEQWVDQEKRILRPGDSAFIAAGVVHASFNGSDRNAKLLAILGPCIGSEGYELVDVAELEPWAHLR